MSIRWGSMASHRSASVAVGRARVSGGAMSAASASVSVSAVEPALGMDAAVLVVLLAADSALAGAVVVAVGWVGFLLGVGVGMVVGICTRTTAARSGTRSRRNRTK